eukprot:TRINITY_DN30139_c0_g1_i3.p1 TRINITY_DN30139_c0_g1~~TRINITY_DN30139_c0_g1_i3.p1  ORF type:complete len:113 (-),score=21.37 TRINITY_DN30139_c0_g1_i3:9-347(-)
MCIRDRDASEHLQDIMRICLAPDPEDRWTAEQLIQHPFFVEDDHRSMGSSASESLSSYEHEDPNETEYAVSYTHLRAHETPEHLVCRLLLEKKKKRRNKIRTNTIFLDYYNI